MGRTRSLCQGNFYDEEYFSQEPEEDEEKGHWSEEDCRSSRASSRSVELGAELPYKKINLLHLFSSHEKDKSTEQEPAYEFPSKEPPSKEQQLFKMALREHSEAKQREDAY